MREPKPKPNCPVCGSENTNGYWGVQYQDPESFEAMECDDCGAKWDQMWVRGRIDDIRTKTGLRRSNRKKADEQ